MIPERLPQHQTALMIEGSAIPARAIFAPAIAFLLISFGAGPGLSLTSPYRDESVSAALLAIASGIWFVRVMVTGFGAGDRLRLSHGFPERRFLS